MNRLLLCVVAIATCVVAIVAATVSETISHTPFLEIGTLWLRSAQNITSQITESVFFIPDLSNPWNYIKLSIGLVLSYYIYVYAIRHMNRIRRLGDLGYVPEHGYSMKEMANIVRKRRQAGDIPPVYPNGWFAIAESHDLKKGESKAVSCLGLELAIFRDTSGASHVLDAYCPHMGANLGVGGQVRGNCIECPFHGWQFRGDDGKCVNIPYTENKYIPEAAKIKSYISVERNNMIYIWYHAEGVEPYWEVPVIEQIASGEWTYRGRTEHHINAHIEEVPENGADLSHLPQVHGPFMSAGIDLRHMYSTLWSFLKHDWQGTWEIDPDEKHMGSLFLTHRLKFFGKDLKVLDLHVVAKQIGPGLVHMSFESLLGRGVFVHTIVPIEPMVQRVIHNFHFNRSMPTLVSNFIINSEAQQVERDIMIWNNKRYLSKPMFVKSTEDSSVAKHRRWYSQFYSENSPRLKFQKDTLEF